MAHRQIYYQIQNNTSKYEHIKTIKLNVNCELGQQIVMGKSMEDWCRFSVCFWHTFRGTGKLDVPYFSQAVLLPLFIAVMSCIVEKLIA